MEEAVEEEGDGVGARLPALAGRQRRHHLGASLANQLRYGNDLVAARFQRFDQHRQCGDSWRAVPASIVQKNDGALVPRAGLHVRDLLKDAVGDLPGSFAGMLIPVVGVDFVADNDVAQSLNVRYRSGLVVGIGFLVDRVGWPEVKRLHSDLGGK